MPSFIANVSNFWHKRILLSAINGYQHGSMAHIHEFHMVISQRKFHSSKSEQANTTKRHNENTVYFDNNPFNADCNIYSLSAYKFYISKMHMHSYVLYAKHSTFPIDKPNQLKHLHIWGPKILPMNANNTSYGCFFFLGACCVDVIFCYVLLSLLPHLICLPNN